MPVNSAEDRITPPQQICWHL